MAGDVVGLFDLGGAARATADHEQVVVRTVAGAGVLAAVLDPVRPDEGVETGQILRREGGAVDGLAARGQDDGPGHRVDRVGGVGVGDESGVTVALGPEAEPGAQVRIQSRRVDGRSVRGVRRAGLRINRVPGLGIDHAALGGPALGVEQEGLVQPLRRALDVLHSEQPACVRGQLPGVRLALGIEDPRVTGRAEFHLVSRTRIDEGPTGQLVAGRLRDPGRAETGGEVQ
ncbi:hypothetical protein ACLF6K_09680 [Streptomyces xanthophaeus]|uniref:hypothetical protein n=1 Tax=Streptomyces xanthophaeus TaxID=67385 RepID=UPI0039902AC3